MKHLGSKKIQSMEKLKLGVFLFANLMLSPQKKAQDKTQFLNIRAVPTL